MDELKNKIDGIVNDYMVLFPQEYKDFKYGMSLQLKNLNNDFAEVKNTDALERKIYEIPETLFKMICNATSKEEDKIIRTKKFALYFARKYPQFRASIKI